MTTPIKTNNVAQIRDLDNPFEIPGKFNSAEEFKIHFDLPKDEANFLRSLRPVRGTIQAVVSHLLVKLITQLKANGITDITKQPEFIQFVRECKVVDGRESNGDKVSQRTDPTTGFQTGAITTAITTAVAAVAAGSTPPRPVQPTIPSNDSGRKTRKPRPNPEPTK